MKKIFILILVAITGVCADAQTKSKFSKVVPNTTMQNGDKTIQKPIKGVPTNVIPPFQNTLSNFKPIQQTERPSLPPSLQIMRDNEGNIVMIKGSLDQSNVVRDAATATKDYLLSIAHELPLQNPANEFEIVSETTDELGITHVRMQQIFQQIPVHGAAIILHGKDNKYDVLNGRFFPTPVLTTTTPTFSERDAFATIEKDLIAKNIAHKGLYEALPYAGENQAKLVVYHKNRQPKLAWHWIVYPNTLQRFDYFVDAKTNTVLHQFLHTCSFAGHTHHSHEGCEENPPLDGPFTSNALDLFNISRSVNTHLVSNTYYMMDTQKPMYSATKSTLPAKPSGVIITLDAANTSPQTDNFDYDYVKSTNNSWANKTSVSAHYNGGLSYEYFKKIHNRESINGKAGNIISFVNVTDEDGKSMGNAFWNGKSMFYGNGDAAFFSLARGLDVAGHEMSHGVIQETAGLEYEGESGALNESFADIFGAMIDKDDWRIGEDVVKTAVFPSGALRDLSNPNNGGKSLKDNGWQPKNTNEQYKGSEDNGGVHINSGIPNFAFYKFATATTKEKAEKVFYRALTNYLVKSSQFIDLRAAVVQSATDLHGANSAEVTQAKLAFDAVGIGSGGSSTGDNYQTNVNANSGADFVAYTNNDYVGIFVNDLAKNQTFQIYDKEINSRPSISDDGTEIVFIGADENPYLIAIDWTKGSVAPAEALSTSKGFRNIAISKNKNLVAYTTKPENDKVFIVDFSKNPAQQQTFTLYNPTYTEGVATGDVQYSDALDFDLSGEYVMYDAKNALKGKNGTIEYWDIGFIKIYDNKAKTFGDGKVEKLFADLPEQTSVGNPQFSKNSPHIVTFDYIDDFENKTYVTAANIQTGVAKVLVDNKDLGFPSFSKNDEKIAYEGEDFLGNYVATVSLTKDKLGVVANSFKIMKDNTRWPQCFSNGVRKINVGTDDNIFNNVKIYPNPFNDNLVIEANDIADNTQNIVVMDMLGSIVLKQTIQNGKNNIDTQSFSTGTYVIKIGNQATKLIKF
jgi:Zn-dependent metalloprotease